MSATVTPGECLKHAKCSACPLGEYWRKHPGEKAGPLPAQFAAEPAVAGEPRVLVVVEAPQGDDAARGVVAGNAWGATLTELLGKAGLPRRSASWTTAVACKFPGKGRVTFEAWRRKQNAVRKKAKIAPWPTAEEACQGRLLAEMRQHDAVIAVGGAVLRVLGVDAALRVGAPTMDDFGGFPTVTRLDPGGGPLPMIAVDADFHLRGIASSVVINDVRKALRVWRKEPGAEWKDPVSVVKPDAVTVWEALRAAKERGIRVACDIETAPWRHSALTPEQLDLPEGADLSGAIYDARKDRLRCVQFYVPGETEDDPGICYIIPWLSVQDSQTYTREDGSVWFEGYTDAERAAHAGVITWALREVPLVGHNFRMYDRQVLEREFGVAPADLVDTHPLHKLADSDLRHGLRVPARVWTTVGPWKAEHAATDARSDGELYRYGGRDVRVNYKIRVPCTSRASAKGQIHLLPTYTRLQDICVDMHRLGLRFSETRRREHEARLHKEVDAAAEDLRQIAPGLNPNSPVQVRALVYDTLGAEVTELTDSGDPSTADDVLRSILFSPGCSADLKALIVALRRHRRYAKLLGTYIQAWDPKAGLADRFDPVGDPDGWYLHTDYNACGTLGWRFSSSRPNLQNVTGEYLVDKTPAGKVRWSLRDIFEAPPGHVYIGADMDQLELRLAAALAQCDALLSAIEKGEIDTHNLSGQVVYGDDYWKLEGAPKDPREKGKGKFKQTRDLIKRFVYAVLYEALPPTIRDLLAEWEDEYGNYPYAGLTVREVTAIRSKWLAGFPEFRAWWASTKAQAAKDGYLAEPVWGLRRYFYGVSKPNEVINFRVQAGGGAVVHQAMFNALEVVPFDLSGRTGLVQQVHDSLMFQVKGSASDANVQQMVRDLTQAMTIRVPGIPVTFTAEAKAGRRWSDT